jgi:hypothetical protein
MQNALKRSRIVAAWRTQLRDLVGHLNGCRAQLKRSEKSSAGTAKTRRFAVQEMMRSLNRTYWADALTNPDAEYRSAPTTSFRCKRYDAVFALQSSKRVLRYWNPRPWKKRAQADRFIAVCRQIEQECTGARLAIEHGADGRFIGWWFMGFSG